MQYGYFFGSHEIVLTNIIIAINPVVRLIIIQSTKNNFIIDGQTGYTDAVSCCTSQLEFIMLDINFIRWQAMLKIGEALWNSLNNSAIVFQINRTT